MSAHVGAHRTRVLHPSTGNRLLRVGLALATTVGVIGALTEWSPDYRHAEALMTGSAAGLFGPTGVDGPSWLEHHGDYVLWFTVTRQCSSALLLTPVAAFTVWMILQRRVRISMVLAGAAVGVAVLVVLNTIRLAVIGIAFQHWGNGSMWLTHDLVGSLISLVAAFSALVAQVCVTLMRDRSDVCTFADG